MRFESSRGTDVQYMYVCPGMTTASWEVTGVLVEGGVPFGERSEPTFLFRRAAGEENFGLKGRFP